MAERDRRAGEASGDLEPDVGEPSGDQRVTVNLAAAA